MRLVGTVDCVNRARSLTFSTSLLSTRSCSMPSMGRATMVRVPSHFSSLFPALEGVVGVALVCLKCTNNSSCVFHLHIPCGIKSKLPQVCFTRLTCHCVPIKHNQARSHHEESDPRKVTSCHRHQTNNSFDARPYSPFHRRRGQVLLRRIRRTSASTQPSSQQRRQFRARQEEEEEEEAATRALLRPRTRHSATSRRLHRSASSDEHNRRSRLRAVRLRAPTRDQIQTMSSRKWWTPFATRFTLLQVRGDSIHTALVLR